MHSKYFKINARNKKKLQRDDSALKKKELKEF